MINYLEHGITAEYLKKGKERLNFIIQSVKDRCYGDTKMKAKTMKEGGATLAKQQLNALNYIS